MNKSNKNNVWGVEEYETPTIATLNIQSEGLLCVSQIGGGIDNATEENWGDL